MGFPRSRQRCSNGLGLPCADESCSLSSAGGEKDSLKMRTIVLLAFAFAGIGTFVGCASDSNSSYRPGSKQDAGSCNLPFCPQPPAGSGVACCINGHCGVNFNNTGCIDLGRRDGG